GDSGCQVPELRSTERSATLAIGDDGGRPLRRSNWGGWGAGVSACGVGDWGCQVPELRSTERSATLAIGDEGGRPLRRSNWGDGAPGRMLAALVIRDVRYRNSDRRSDRRH